MNLGRQERASGLTHPAVQCVYLDASRVFRPRKTLSGLGAGELERILLRSCNMVRRALLIALHFASLAAVSSGTAQAQMAPVCGPQNQPCPPPGYVYPPPAWGVPPTNPQPWGPSTYPPPNVRPPAGYQAPYSGPYVPSYTRSYSRSSTEEATLGILADGALRVGSFDVQGSDADARTTGIVFSLSTDIANTSDYVSLRSRSIGALGGGSDGLEGQLEHAHTVGLRGYIGDEHGPFLRAGLAYQLLGNNKCDRLPRC